MIRKIIHIDMDAFFAAVEQRDNPELRGKAIAIGSASKRGVVATASYEARKFGVHSALPSVTALRRCPQLIFVRGDMEKYKAISLQIRAIFEEYTDLVEPLSIDEAYLDVTENKVGQQSATLLAKEIQKRIFDETRLTASAGVSYNKFLAKIASDYRKPNGVFVVTPDEAAQFIAKLKIEKFFGIGKVTAEKMHKMGIFFGDDLKKLSQHRLTQTFGKAGAYYYQIVRGNDNRTVNPHRERKSVGGENTFSSDVISLDEQIKYMQPIVEKVFERIKRSQKYGRTLTLKVKYADFTQITRSKTVIDPIIAMNTLWENTMDLLNEAYDSQKSVRLLGVSVSNFLTEEQEAIQLKIDWDKAEMLNAAY
ncbi:MAG: DNA polymerase IV [Salinivirgaceae bacterium]|jgi:DNA polymerase-4|nr:DNA polymerase IV [Salinivirgaceae bacterium]